MFVCVHVCVYDPSLRMNFNLSYYTSALVRIHQRAAPAPASCVALAVISIAEHTIHSLWVFNILYQHAGGQVGVTF